MKTKQFWDHSGKPSVFVEVKDGVEVYRGPFSGAKADKHAELKEEIENLRKERDEAVKLAQTLKQERDEARKLGKSSISYFRHLRRKEREMSDRHTPVTDAVAAYEGNWDTKALRMTAHARKLELERDEAREERDALRDAVNALHDYVHGKRNDYKDISEILNGAMKI